MQLQSKFVLCLPTNLVLLVFHERLVNKCQKRAAHTAQGQHGSHRGNLRWVWHPQQTHSCCFVPVFCECVLNNEFHVCHGTQPKRTEVTLSRMHSAVDSPSVRSRTRATGKVTHRSSPGLPAPRCRPWLLYSVCTGPRAVVIFRCGVSSATQWWTDLETIRDAHESDKCDCYL